MTLATWLAMLVAGPGALSIFVWFLADLAGRRRRKPPRQDARSAETTARTSADRSGSP